MNIFNLQECPNITDSLCWATCYDSLFPQLYSEMLHWRTVTGAWPITLTEVTELCPNPTSSAEHRIGLPLSFPI